MKLPRQLISAGGFLPGVDKAMSHAVGRFGDAVHALVH